MVIYRKKKIGGYKMSKYQTPCRYDFVGSFLRPQEVKQAKADYAEGKISEEEKDRIIDAAIADVVKKAERTGVSCDY